MFLDVGLVDGRKQLFADLLHQHAVVAFGLHKSDGGSDDQISHRDSY